MGVTRDLAEWAVHTSLDEIPRDVRSAARSALIDTVGAILAGVPEPVTQIVAQVTAGEGARPVASQLGARLKTSVQGAAFVNGVSGHALDYDDVNRSLHGHPSVVVLPAALASAERLRASGGALLEAYIVGVEVMVKVGRALGAGHYHAGWHATSTLGTLGSAAAAGKLLGLDADRLTSALAIAVSESSGSRRNFGTMTKPFHAGHASRCGVAAAQLAQAGMTGDESAIEAPLGFFALFAPQATPRPDLAETLGRPYELVSSGLSVKKYPCCFATHRAADGVLELVAHHDVAPDDVAAVEVTVPHGLCAPLISRRPQTGLEGKFSMAYVVAAAILDRSLTLETFTDPRVRRPSVQRLLDRVTVREDETIPVEYNSIEDGYVEVRLRLEGDRELVRRVERPRGSAGHPLRRDELLHKFRDCAGRVLAEAQVERALAGLESVEAAADVATLVECLVPPEA
jgi:2-methylcitrate dehydratase PrpD